MLAKEIPLGHSRPEPTTTGADPFSLRSSAAHLRGSGITAFVTGTVIYQAGRLVLSIVAARILGPEAFGDWVLVMLVVVYLNAAGLGITNGLGRQLPFLSGAGELHEARHVASVATGATVVSGLGAALLGAAITVPLMPGRWHPVTALLVAVAAALQHPFLLQQVLFRSWFAFRQAAVQLATLGVVVLVGGLALVGFGLNGLLLSQVVTYVVAIGLGLRLLPETPWPSWDWPTARGLMSIGFPIMLAGLMYGLLTTLDRWLAATFLDRASVGYYGLVGIALSGMLIIPQLLSQQFYPRMAFAHGAGHSARDLLGLARSQGLMAGAVVGGLAVCTGVGAFVVIPLALPEYSPAVVPLVIALLGMVVYAFGSGYGNLLNTIGAHRRFLAVQTAAVGVNLVLGVSFLSSGAGLEAIAVASAAGMTFYSIMLRRTAAKAAALAP